MIAYRVADRRADLLGRIQTLLGPSALGEEADSQALDLHRDRLSTRLMDVFRVTGSQEAYDLLFSLNEPNLRRFIGTRLRHLPLSLDAGDVLQEAFFNIYRYPYRFRSDRDSSFRVWTGAIVTNVIRRHLRRSSSQPQPGGAAAENASLNLVDPEAGPAMLAIDEESREGFARVYLLFLLFYADSFRMLPLRDRRILRLVELDRKRYREVGARIGTKPDNVKMYVFRARQRLFRLIAERLERAAG